MTHTPERIEDRFDREFGIPGAYLSGTVYVKPEDVKPFIRTEIEKTCLEVIGEDVHTNPMCREDYCICTQEKENLHRSEQRAKLQRIMGKK